MAHILPPGHAPSGLDVQCAKKGKSVYTPTFIEDNEDKVKALQEQYEFTYTIEER